MRGRGVRTRGGSGRGRWLSSFSSRLDNNIFAVLSEAEDHAQDGDGRETGVDIFETSYLDMTVDPDSADNDWNIVPCEQLKRQRISSSGQGGQDSNFSRNQMEDDIGDYDSLLDKDKLSLILSKLSLNEQRVKYIQYKVDSMVPVKKRVTEIENVVRFISLKKIYLLEYRSLDSEARSRRRNLLFKGIPENKYESCFEEARRFIHEKLHIDQDMYLERAHRLGRFDSSKNRPIIVAFRDYCDTEHILQEAKCLKGTDLGVSRDYPNEISKARQSKWKQFKSIRENNTVKKVTFGYPASIHVNGVTVVDIFRDWYDVLKGSRTGSPQSQSNQPAMSGDHPKTGLSGSCPERDVSTSNDWPRDQNKSGAFTAGKPSPMSGPGFVD